MRGCLSLLPTVHLQMDVTRRYRDGQSVSALPGGPGASDIDLFRYGKGIINLDAKVAHRALDLGVAKQELHGS